MQPSTTDIWLIHGTWARHARWAEASSPFCEGLRHNSSIPVETHAFSWTGRNRTFDRRVAAENLRATVRSTTPNGERFAIAHSHGGNIVTEAMRDDPHLFKAVVTLNTPFFSLLPRSLVTVVLHFLLFLGSATVLPSHFLHQSTFAELAIKLGLDAVVVATGYWFLWRPLMRSNPLDLLSNRLAGLRSTSEPDPPILCISATDDEAFTWLDAVDAFLNLPYLLLHRLALPVTLGLLTFAHWWWQWDFSTGALEYSAFFEDHQSMRSEAQRSLASGSLPTFLSVMKSSLIEWYSWTPPALTGDQIHSASTLIWNHEGSFARFATLTVSTFEYFLVFWTLLAVASLGASYLVRGFVFGSGFGPRAFVECLLTRHKVTQTPLDFTNVELLLVDHSREWLLHSALHGEEGIGALSSDWLTRLRHQRGVGQTKAL